MSTYRRLSGGDPISQDALKSNRRRRNLVQPGKLLCYLGVLMLAGLLYGVVVFMRAVIEDLKHPLKSTYGRPQGIVMPYVEPLITNQTTFDVEATLWLNVTGFLAQHPRLGEEWKHLKIIDYGRGSQRVKEAAVFHGVVFKNVKLGQRQHASVKVRLPAAPFYIDPALGPHLRSSFVILPRAHLNVPTDAALASVRTVHPVTLPFSMPRLGAERFTGVSQARLAGISNLTALHTLAGAFEEASAGSQLFLYATERELQFPAANETTATNLSHPVILVNYTDSRTSSGYRFDHAGVEVRNGTTFLSRRARYISTRSVLSIASDAPSFVQARFVEEQESLARHLSECIAKHANQSFPSCDIGRIPDRRQAGPQLLSFTNYAEFEGGAGHPEPFKGMPVYRYTPAMVVRKGASSPSYRRILPDFYSESADLLLKAGVIEYEWYLALDTIPFVLRFVPSDTENSFIPRFHQDRFALGDFQSENATQSTEQPEDRLESSLEMIFTSDRLHPNSKPWRHFGAGLCLLVSTFISEIAEIRYWSTRMTTDGISIPASLQISAGAWMLFGRQFHHHQGWKRLNLGRWVVDWLWQVLNELVCLPVLLRLSWFGCRIGRNKATHRERASARLDAKLTLPMRAALVAVLFGLYYTRIFRKIVLRAALGPAADELDDRTSGPTFDKGTLGPLSLALLHAGLGAQIWFSFQTRTFAGGPKLNALLALVNTFFFELALEHVYALSGHLEARSELTLAGLIFPALTVVRAYQALTLPSVPQTTEDDDE
ncbi:hypothetical protein V8E36_007051 [Tilletia maclaganii]